MYKVLSCDTVSTSMNGLLMQKEEETGEEGRGEGDYGGKDEEGNRKAATFLELW